VRIRWIVAVVLVLLGLVWIGQGLGIIQGSSVMTGDTRWAIAGAVIVAVGAVIAGTALNRRPKV
jgi:type IV secretory pathway TrbL component